MLKIKLIISLCILLSSIGKSQTSKEIILKSINAHGGIEKWDQIKYIKSERIGHANWLEQSEHPNGPFLVGYEDVKETRSIRSNRLTAEIKQRHFQFPEWQKTSYVLNENILAMKRGENMFPMPMQFKGEYDQWLMYAPEVHLYAALNYKNLKTDSLVNFQGTPHYQLKYELNGNNCTLLLNKHTFLISVVEFNTSMPYNFFWHAWGNFKTKIHYGLYNLYDGGIRYPVQWDIYRKGLHFNSVTFTNIEFLKEVENNLFVIPSITKKQNSQRPQTKINDIIPNESKIVKIAEGIEQISNSWNVGWVVQKDGIIIIESPMSSGYSSRIIKMLAQRYPEKKIQGVICTSDAWPHVAGVREYIARKIPVYSHPLSIPLLKNISQANFNKAPDLLSKNKEAAIFNQIKNKYIFKDKNTPFQVIPINGEGGERYLLLYFPKQKVMYSSDLLFHKNKRTGKYFMPQYQSEIQSVVDRENLQVEKVFGMHLNPMDWNEIEDALEKVLHSK